MFLPAIRGKGRPWLVLLCVFLFPLTVVQAATDNPAATNNQADVQLKADINTLAVQIGQGAPLPPGGCKPGYLWHTTYGGCRIAQAQSETGLCPSGYTGSRVRYRTAYILQANSADVVYEGWGAWQDRCQALPPATVTFQVLRRPGGVDCRFPEFRVRATYPDGSAARGIGLTWSVIGDGALDRYSSNTDGNGEASVYGTVFPNMQLTARVSWQASAIEIYGICIGGT